jgi:hypothetical protein
MTKWAAKNTVREAPVVKAAAPAPVASAQRRLVDIAHTALSIVTAAGDRNTQAWIVGVAG